jgi:hypothetical protein
MNDQPAKSPKMIVWWAIWLIALLEPVLARLFHSPANPQQAGGPVDFSGAMIALILLGISILLRWGVLGFLRGRGVVFALFVAGILFAVAAANVSLFSGCSFGGKLFAVSVLGIVQFLPLFARQPSES